MPDAKEKGAAGNRLAKVIARAGLCSRRDAEQWIAAGRVRVNGKDVRTPAFNVGDDDRVEVDGNPLQRRAGTRLWLYHKPAGLVVTESDPEGRPTIFEALDKHGLPRVLTVGRLDINTEGLLLLTNDGGLKRVLELPATGWLRRYRVRAHGRVTQEQLDTLKSGIEVEGIKYGPIEAELERVQGGNVWLTVSLREGKNREVKNVLETLGLQVNRLIRVSYGPFQLGDIPLGAVTVVRARILRDQLGKKLAEQAGVDFDSPLPEDAEPEVAARNPNRRVRAKTDGALETAPKPRGRTGARNQDRDATKAPRRAPERKGNFDFKPRAPKEPKPVEKRTVHFTDGRPSEEFEPQAKSARSADAGRGARRDERPGGGARGPRRDDRTGSGGPGRGSRRDDRPRSDEGGRGPRRDDRPRGDRPQRDDGERRQGERGRPPRRDGETRLSDRGRPRRDDDRPRGDRGRPERSDRDRSGGSRGRGGPGPEGGRPPRSDPPRKGPPRGPKK